MFLPLFSQRNSGHEVTSFRSPLTLQTLTGAAVAHRAPKRIFIAMYVEKNMYVYVNFLMSLHVLSEPSVLELICLLCIYTCFVVQLWLNICEFVKIVQLS